MSAKNGQQKRPWYLRELWVYVMCMVWPQAGLINVLVHRNQWEHEDSSRYVGVAIFFNVIFWGLPVLTGVYYGDFTLLWLHGVVLLVMLLIVLLWPKKKQEASSN